MHLPPRFCLEDERRDVPTKRVTVPGTYQAQLLLVLIILSVIVL